MEFKDLSPDLKLILQKAEELDWTSTVWIEESQNDRTYAELGKHSPAGEDFSMVIDFDKEDQADTFISDLREYFENFDVDEHVEMWLPSRGKGGCPSSVRELVEDAEAIEKMVEGLLDALDDMRNERAKAIVRLEVMVGRRYESLEEVAGAIESATGMEVKYIIESESEKPEGTDEMIDFEFGEFDIHTIFYLKDNAGRYYITEV